MTQIEKIEKALSFTYNNDNGEMKIYEKVVKDFFINDNDIDIIIEKANGVCDVYNTSENKETIFDMEVEDIIKLIPNK